MHVNGSKSSIHKHHGRFHCLYIFFSMFWNLQCSNLTNILLNFILIFKNFKDSQIFLPFHFLMLFFSNIKKTRSPMHEDSCRMGLPFPGCWHCLSAPAPPFHAAKWVGLCGMPASRPLAAQHLHLQINLPSLLD